MLQPLKLQKNNDTVTVCGIPFSVVKNGEKVESITGEGVAVGNAYPVLFFLGLCNEELFASEWWGPNESFYDHSERVFLGDVLGYITVVFTNGTCERIPVIFGVNCFHYDIFCKPQEFEAEPNVYSPPYDEPFRSDESAARLLDEALRLNWNESEDAQKNTKWVMCYRVKSKAQIKHIKWDKYPSSKHLGFCISAITAADSAEHCDGFKTVDLDFFHSKKYFSSLDRVRRRLYQYADELPQSVEVQAMQDFDAPDIRFGNSFGNDILTNVYRCNITDMAYNKLTDDGMAHTSSAGSLDYGHYTGFGSFKRGGMYSSQIWSRDTGPLMKELIRAGYGERVKMLADKLHEFLYYPSKRYHVPHWKRAVNVTLDDEAFDYFDGNENDGHASLMLGMYELYKSGTVTKEWLMQNREHLKAAADYFLWQKRESELTGFDGLLYSHSEVSTQRDGGFDLFSNILASSAAEKYSRLLCEIDEVRMADELEEFSKSLLQNAHSRFTMEHPRFGRVYTDTLEDCWSYEYKRFAELFMASDNGIFDIHEECPSLFEVFDRTFSAQKESYYCPRSGRQMGYGQSYLTQAALLLDRVEEMNECVASMRGFCYHHTEMPYIVPEGVVCHGSGAFWYRNSDLGNLVQQTEVIKTLRLMVGISDGERFRWIPRLPDSLTEFSAKDAFVFVNGKRQKTSLRYKRGKDLPWYAQSGDTAYSMSVSGVAPEYIRVGPFKSDDIKTNATLLKIKKINANIYAYIKIEE